MPRACQAILGEFFNDVLRTTQGHVSSEVGSRLVRGATVLVPALLACAGPQLYLPLLSLAGAFPTAFVYGLMPPVITLALRGL